MFMITLKSILRCDFLRREDGNITLEAVIIMPLLFWTYLAMFSIFDAFRQYSLNLKATYTIGDAISRETVPLDAAYLDGTQQMFDFLTGGKSTSAIRVTSIRYDATADQFSRDWSQTRGEVIPLENVDVLNWHDKLPVMPDNERVMLVETWTQYTPPFKTGLEVTELKNFVFTRPRYAPRVCWITCPTGS